MLVMFYGLSRVFFAMARDGLLPSYFSRINSYTQTPARIIIGSGIVMALIAGFLPMQDLAELVNIGTLFAFITVCLGVIWLRYTQPKLLRPFKTPLMPWVPLLGVLSCGYLIIHLPRITLIRFVVWMAIGFVVYFTYSRHASGLNPQKKIK